MSAQAGKNQAGRGWRRVVRPGGVGRLFTKASGATGMLYISTVSCPGSHTNSRVEGRIIALQTAAHAAVCITLHALQKVNSAKVSFPLFWVLEIHLFFINLFFKGKNHCYSVHLAQKVEDMIYVSRSNI